MGNGKETFILRGVAWAVLLTVITAALVIVIAPVWIVQPFKAETERGLAISYTMRRWSPILTIVALAFSITLIVWLWRRTRRWFIKAMLVIVMLPLIPAAWLVR